MFIKTTCNLLFMDTFVISFTNEIVFMNHAELCAIKMHEKPGGSFRSPPGKPLLFFMVSALFYHPRTFDPRTTCFVRVRSGPSTFPLPEAS